MVCALGGEPRLARQGFAGDPGRHQRLSPGIRDGHLPTGIGACRHLVHGTGIPLLEAGGGWTPGLRVNSMSCTLPAAGLSPAVPGFRPSPRCRHFPLHMKGRPSEIRIAGKGRRARDRRGPGHSECDPEPEGHPDNERDGGQAEQRRHGPAPPATSGKGRGDQRHEARATHTPPITTSLRTAAAPYLLTNSSGEAT
jgi:hypothetical protein